MKTQKMLTLVMSVFVLMSAAGCKDSYEAKTFDTVPPELADCKFFVLSKAMGSDWQVVRCPNSSTSVAWTSGKSRHHTAIAEEGQPLSTDVAPAPTIKATPPSPTPAPAFEMKCTPVAGAQPDIYRCTPRQAQ